MGTEIANAIDFVLNFSLWVADECLSAEFEKKYILASGKAEPLQTPPKPR